MAFWKFWKKHNSEGKVRKIKTIRGQKKIDNAIAKGTKLIIKNVEPFSTVKGKYCLVQNKKTGKKYRIHDFRDTRSFSKDYEVIQHWTYEYHNYDFPKVAAYVIPNDIKEGEIVRVKDLIENFLSYESAQGRTERLKSCKAIWKNNNLEIQYNPNVDRIRAVG